MNWSTDLIHISSIVPLILFFSSAGLHLGSHLNKSFKNGGLLQASGCRCWVQDMLRPNMALWWTEDLKPKEFEKMTKQEGHPDHPPPPTWSPSSLKTEDKSPMWKIPSMYQEDGGHPSPQRWGIQLYKQTLLFPHRFLPLLQTPLSCLFFTDIYCFFVYRVYKLFFLATSSRLHFLVKVPCIYKMSIKPYTFLLLV